MTKSKDPQKQRKERFNAPRHQQRKYLSSKLDHSLATRYHRRSFPLAKGDRVEIMRGENRGYKNEVIKVDPKSSSVQIEGVVQLKGDGTRIPKWVPASNLKILKLYLNDQKRRDKITEKVAPDQRKAIEAEIKKEVEEEEHRRIEAEVEEESEEAEVEEESEEAEVEEESEEAEVEEESEESAQKESVVEESESTEEASVQEIQKGKIASTDKIDEDKMDEIDENEDNKSNDEGNNKDNDEGGD